MKATTEKRLHTALEMEECYLSFFKKCHNLYPWYATFFFDAKIIIESHLWAIKEYNKEVQELKNEIHRINGQLKPKE